MTNKPQAAQVGEGGMLPVICPSCGYEVEDQGYRGKFWICKRSSGMKEPAVIGCIADGRPLQFWPIIHPRAIQNTRPTPQPSEAADRLATAIEKWIETEPDEDDLNEPWQEIVKALADFRALTPISEAQEWRPIDDLARDGTRWWIGNSHTGQTQAAWFSEGRWWIQHDTCLAPGEHPDFYHALPPPPKEVK